MRTSLAVIFLLFLTRTGSAQHRPDTLRDVIRSIYFQEKDVILTTHSDGYSLFSPDNPKPSIRKQIRGWNHLMATADFHLADDRLLIIDRTEHSVYEILGDRLVLRDRVNHPKVSIDHIIFRHSNDLYLFGGYGLWSNRRSLLRLNESARWEPVVFERKPGDTEETAFPPGIHTGTAAVIGDRAFLFKGQLVDKNDGLINPYNPEVWVLDIKHPRWTKLGMINRSVFRTEMENQITLAGDGRMFLLPDSRAVVELEKEGNRVRRFGHTLASSEILNNDKFRFMAFIRKGKVHYHYAAVKADEHPDGKEAVVYRVVPLPEFLGKPQGEDVFYTPATAFSFYWLLVPLGLISGYAGLRLFRHKREPALLEVTAEGLVYRSVLHELDAHQSAVLKRLLEANDMVSSNELTAIIRNPNLQYSHNNRVKNEIVRELNLRFKSILNIKQELITSTVSEQDKRYRWYRIDRTYFRV